MPVPSRLPDLVVITPPPRHVFYLHGFTSSARSAKAAFFEQRLRARGVSFGCPDFNEPDFRTLTMTRMLGRLSSELDGAGPGPIALIGSSLGGTLAILAAERFRPRIDRIVLLAPAVMFATPGHHLLPPERIAEWRQKGALPFFHHAYNEERLLDVAFYEDSLQYDVPAAAFIQPTIVFQGLQDTAVDYRSVDRFVRARSNATLSLLDDDHQLAASLPGIWHAAAPFLGLTA